MMVSLRDEFPRAVIETLGRRVGFLCSNPSCRQATTGPHEKESAAVNIGVAAHITAASPRGPRYDPSLSADERRSAANGIWVCQSCAKLIDTVALGLAASLGHPGGNVTGMTLQTHELPGKRLELLRDAIPRVSRVALFWNSRLPGTTEVK